MKLLDLWLALGRTTDEELALLVAAYELNRISEDLFIQTATLAVLTANQKATTLADMAVATLARGLVLGLMLPLSEQERIVRAFSTMTRANPDDLPMRARRMGRAEPLNRGRKAYQEALRRRGAESWRRVVQPDACPGCAGMAGEERPIGVEFWDHPGCRCTLAPTNPQTWADTVRATQLQVKAELPTGRFSSGLRFSR